MSEINILVYCANAHRANSQKRTKGKSEDGKDRLKREITSKKKYPMHVLKNIAWDTSHLLGWKKGLEPSTFGTTIRRSNQLSYIHRLTRCKSSTFSKNTNLAMSHTSPLCMRGLLITLTLFTSLLLLILKRLIPLNDVLDVPFSRPHEHFHNSGRGGIVARLASI